MTKRILALVISILIIVMSVPAFATFDTTFPNDNYGGSIRSSSFAMAAIEHLQQFVGGTFPLDSPLFLTFNSSRGSVSVFSPRYDYTSSYHAVIDGQNFFRAWEGSEYDYNASMVPTYEYVIGVDVNQAAANIFLPDGDFWVTYANASYSVADLNASTVFYGNPSVNIYDSSGNLLEWPWTSGSSNIQYQIPLSPGNMLVLGDYQGTIELNSINITASGLPPSGGTSQPTWFTGLRIGPFEDSVTFWQNNGANSYNSPATNAYWSKQLYSTGLDGVTTKGIISLGPTDYNKTSFFIYNPIGITTNSGNIYNPTVYVTLTGTLPESIYIYPAFLQDGVSSFPRDFSNDMYDPLYRPVVVVGFDENKNIYYTNTSGDLLSTSIANVPGGYNSFYETTTDPSNSVQSSVDGILNILQSGSSSVESLTNGSQSFFQTLKGMFAWLPDEVLAILIAALILVFTIGVIKVLL